ncbi:MAG TPA: tripartite tricarboxylate transporter substrate binding protein [Ramlibacter sp.]|nr:tripartite tricarboxylate transporter substrate binding protein [Ramlibacter sp.]
MTIDCRRRQLALGLAAAAATGWTPGAWAQGSTPFPSKPVMLIVPNAPGGAIDILARVMQQQLQTLWNQTVIVEYKAGAGTTVGTDFTAKAQPNGYTLCLVATPHVINPALRQLPYDTVKDLSGITILGVSNILISANPNFPANNLKDAIAVIQKSPGKYSYASPGSGSSMHLAMELLKQSAGLDILHVPFKGRGPAYPEVMSGRIDLLVDPLFSTMPFIRGGKLKPLALTALKRSTIAPEIAPVAETVPGFNVQSMFGLVVASGTPREVVQKIYSDVVVALQKPETQKKMADLGMEPVTITPEQFDAQIKSDIERWTHLVKAAHITAD